MKKSTRKYIILYWTIILLPIVIFTTLFTLISTGKMGFMPSFKDLENPENQIASQVYSEDRVNLGNFFIENRTYIDFDDLSPNIINALIATEDSRFEKHGGIDGRALLRVAFGVISGNSKGGGSTITQQLAKNLFPRDTARNRSRIGKASHLALVKFKEWVTAVKLERNYTKEEILVMYFNTVYFGYQSFGVKLAAKTFFNTTPRKLDINQSAILVGLLKAPSYYNPVRHPERATKRRNIVLGQMRKYEYITQQQYDSISAQPLNLEFNIQDHNVGLATYFREYLRLKLNKKNPFELEYSNEKQFKIDSAKWVDDPLYGWCNKNFKPNGETYNLYTDGLKIHTTVNSKMQQYAEEAMVEHLKNDLQPAFDLEKKYSKTGPFSSELEPEDVERILELSMKRSSRWWTMKGNGRNEEEIEASFKKPVKMTIFSYKGEIDTVMTPEDSILYYKKFLHSGFMAMDPHTGHVKAYVGGINFKHFKFDHVTRGRRQVGSTFKPFLYTLAMMEGLTPCDKVPNVPVTFTLITGETWTPESVGPARLKRKRITLKTGLALSINNISAWIMQQFNPKSVIDITRLMGVRSPIPEVPSICLGSADLTLEEMVGAYSTFANKGIYTEPLYVTKIEDKSGNTLANFQPRRNEAISENAAFLMLNLLEGVVNHGTSIRLRSTYEFESQIAGKTGTTNNHSDGWFMGVIPQLVSGVWTGGEERSIHFDGIGLGQGANMALPVYALFLQKVYQDESLGISPEATFEKPDNFYIDLNCEADTEGDSIEKESFDDEFFN